MKTKFYLLVILFFIYLKSTAQNFPFPQHTVYAKESILPNCYNQQQLDNQTKYFYQDWKNKYLKNNCNANEYYIWFDNAIDDKNQAMCTSEAQGYGMLIAVFMAGVDADAQNIFNGLYKFSRSHKSNIQNNFMAWKQEGCIDTNENNNNSATDGDMDIAYSLLLADKQWGSNGEINYLKSAKLIINNLYNNCINPKTKNILFGDWVNEEEGNKYNGTRTSDFMCNHFEAFSKATNNKKWLDVSKQCYTILEKVTDKNTGLIPDFIEDANEKPTPAQKNFIETKYDGEYFYNACRVPFRLALHYLINGDKTAIKPLSTFVYFIKKTTQNDPQKIESGYFLNGDVIKKSEVNSSAFIGSIAIASMVENNKDKIWLNNCYNLLLLQQVQHNNYYDNTLKMLYLIVLSGNWWCNN